MICKIHDVYARKLTFMPKVLFFEKKGTLDKKKVAVIIKGKGDFAGELTKKVKAN